MESQKIVVVTGGNSGIGYETVKALLQSEKAYAIYLGSRNQEKGSAAVEALRQECPDSENTVELLQVDVASDESIEKACEQVKARYGHLDILINNAGATFDIEYLRNKISLRDCFTSAYNANVAGAHIMTHTFMPLLLQSSSPRLIFVAGLSFITQAAEKYFPTPPLPAGWPKKLDFETIGYRCSKTALNMLMLDWNHKLKEDGVKVWCVAPGMLDTNLGDVGPEIKKKMGLGHASIGGRLLRSVVEGERDGETGRIVAKDGIAAW
ncbi:MAG: hypothetical protein M1820_010933 [Bogoriella megaspora]|nr:MAG: hypothetical protein M1820_010933 [Bogoriella megaspora]